MSKVIGLDIGTSAVRAAELELNGRATVLTGFSQVGLPPGAMVDGEVQDHSALVAALRRLWQNGKFSGTSVVVGIAGLRVITRELELPWVADNEVESAVRFQSEEVIPFTAEKTLLSAQVLADSTAEDGSRTRRVLVAAAHHDVVDGVVSAVEAAGLHVTGVDMVSSALVRALADPAQPSEQPEAIVSVGAGLTVIVVHQGGRPQFVRTVGTGGNAATEAIAGALDLPFSDAEALKRLLDGSTTQRKAAQRAADPVVDELVAEIRNSIQYFASMPGRQPLARVLVTGAGAQLQGFMEELGGQVRIPVLAVSPLAWLDTSTLELEPSQEAALAPVLATAVGLALPEPNPAVKKFNLVPPEVRRREFDRKVTRYTVVGAAVLALLMVGLGGWRLWSVHSAESDVSSLKANVNALTTQVPTYDRALATVNELHTAQGQVTHISTEAVDWSAVVSQLDAVAPTGLGVQSLQGTGGPNISSPGSSSSSASSANSSTGTTPGAGTAGGIGTLTVSVAGSFPSTAHFSPVAEWIDAISGSAMFAPPSVSSVANADAGGATNVTFQSVVSILSGASMAKNGSY
jgi:type IV pilus assembly protein PilM